MPRIANQLAQLDLANASIFVRGPQPAIDAAFRVIGRRPVMIDP